MNYWYIFLCSFISPLLLLISSYESSFIILLLILIFISLILFSINNILLFLIYYELIISSLLFLLLFKSYSNYRIRSSLIFFLFSSLSSFLLSLILLLYLWFLLLSFIIYFGLLFILAIGIKVPLFPFYYWLPIVHSESSTSLSLLLAALILKLSIYTILRFYISIIYISLSYYIFIIICFSIIGVILTLFDLFLRLDFKIIIALSSISHMNLTSAAIFSLSFSGFISSIIISFSHGLSSISLFLFVGLIINKSLSRSIDSLWFCSFYYRFLLFLIFLANLSFPLSFIFISEILAFYSLFSISSFISLLLFILSAFLSFSFFFLFFNRILLYYSFHFYFSYFELWVLSFSSLHNYFIGSIFYL